jgi:hypothetical protein
MPSSVRRVTTLDHERLHRLLRRVCTPGPSQERWREEFVGLLRAHRTAERDVVLVQLVSPGEPLEPVARELAAADVELDRLAEQARAADLNSSDLEALRRRADALLSQHAEGWSTRLLTPLEQSVARSELRRLGGAYQERRDGELVGAGVVQAPPRRLDLSRAELYEMARRAGIEGRSAMTRGQLIDELQRRSG